MKLIKKITILSFILGFGFLPSFASIDGKISKDAFYDAEKTIMTEIPLNKTLTTEKYWEKNLFYFNKYRPLFMLSNKELFDLMPKENVSVVQRITAPSVYSISFKTSSIKNISLAPASPAKNLVEIKKPAPLEKVTKKVQKPDLKLYSLYEQAKNPEADSDKKIDTALLLKESKNFVDYGLAIDLLNDVTAQEPYNAYAFYLKGELYSRQKDSKSAMKNYIEALKINPTSKQCCLGIAKILEPTNKELAKKYYEKAK